MLSSKPRSRPLLPGASRSSYDDIKLSRMAEFTVVTADSVNVTVSSNITQYPMQKRFQKGLTILQLKNKLELVTGGSAATMRLSLLDKQDQFVCYLDSETALFGSFPVDEGMRLHVEDKTCHKGEFEDTSGIQKYELTEEQYNSKQGERLTDQPPL
ncbi:tubulin-folding cofactor B-like isoform X2 [Amphibalanus amphitrite]|uniref:tubulin-folding cofactor B-like isoform X2 n=1 Tax=Amphibalanus amphitrite TaxID=1232801 RepID=UPI001C91DB1E|nr:tubulin-folding cofactor B-like isoform X2 [Amphibalanus amphitrite]